MAVNQGFEPLVDTAVYLTQWQESWKQDEDQDTFWVPKSILRDKCKGESRWCQFRAFLSLNLRVESQESCRVNQSVSYLTIVQAE